MNRARIMELLSAYRGMHKSQIKRELGLAWGQLSHHLAVLSREKRIQLEYHGQECWAFLPFVSFDERERLVAAGKPWRRKLIGWLGGRGASTLAELCDDLQASKHVVRHHLGHLMAAGLVHRTGSNAPRYELSEIQASESSSA
ncbi:MAG: hypothetical protein ACPHK8_03015 [Thermoplasmatota archaeon]